MKAIFQQLGNNIWKTTAPTKGKSVTILGGVHGNELTGIQVIDKLRATCPPLENGSLTLIIGNPKAVEKGTRGSEPHQDLNRCFTEENLADPCPTEDYELNRAREIAPFLKDSDIMIDLHSTNKPSEPFLRLAGKVTQDHLSICRWFPCDILLRDPNYLLAEKVALTDEYVGHCGGLGICYESGVASDTTSVTQLEHSLIQILSHEAGILPLSDSIELLPPNGPSSVYDIYKVLRLSSTAFEWGPTCGTKNFEYIPPNTLIGSFADESRWVSDRASYLIFPKVRELWRQGAPVGWLATKLE